MSSCIALRRGGTSSQVSGRSNQLLIPKMNLTQQKLAAASSSLIVRPLGAFEEFLWLFDQSSPLHFALAAQVEGHTTISEWRRALDSLQKRHPFFSVYIEKNQSAVPNFRHDSSASILLRVVQGADVAKTLGVRSRTRASDSV
jgi:hypothetical protein